MENLVDLHFNAVTKAFIAPSVSDIEGSDMHVIISAPHLLIADDIKCQPSFVFSRIKRQISLLCLRKVATLWVLLSLLFDIQFSSHISTVDVQW